MDNVNDAIAPIHHSQGDIYNDLDLHKILV